MDLVYVGPLSNQSADCFPAIVERAKGAGAMVAANPGIRQLTARAAGFMGAIAGLDLLNINRVEAEALVPVFAANAEGPDTAAARDAPALVRRGLSFGGFEMGLVRFIRAVQAAGPRWVSITDGVDGSYLGTPDAVLWHPSVPAEVAGTAGAGDGFCSTLSAALAEGMAPEAAMREGAVNAASVVEHLDTTAGLLRPDEMRARVARIDGEVRRIDG
jgi:ribokinase